MVNGVYDEHLAPGRGSVDFEGVLCQLNGCTAYVLEMKSLSDVVSGRVLGVYRITGACKMTGKDIKIESRDLNLWYGDSQALKNAMIAIPEKKPLLRSVHPDAANPH